MIRTGSPGGYAQENLDLPPQLFPDGMEGSDPPEFNRWLPAEMILVMSLLPHLEQDTFFESPEDESIASKTFLHSLHSYS